MDGCAVHNKSTYIQHDGRPRSIHPLCKKKKRLAGRLLSHEAHAYQPAILLLTHGNLEKLAGLLLLREH